MFIDRYEIQVRKKKIWYKLLSIDGDALTILALSKALKKGYRIYDILNLKKIGEE